MLKMRNEPERRGEQKAFKVSLRATKRRELCSCVENTGERAVRFVTGRAICYYGSAIPVSGLPSCPETVSPEEVTI